MKIILSVLMEIHAEEQLNKLIHAYNSKENVLDDEEVDDMMRASMDIAAFEMKFKKPCKSTAKKPRARSPVKRHKDPNDQDGLKLSGGVFDKISIPPLPENLKAQFYQETLNSQLEAPKEGSRGPEFKIATMEELNDQIEKLRLEDESAKNEPYEKRIKEAAGKNKNLGLLLQKERTLRIEAESQSKALLKQIEEMKRRPTTNPEFESAEKKISSEYKTKIQSLEEKISTLNLKLGSNESELAKCMKVLRSEVGEFQSLDDLLKPENGWKGRAQKIELLRAKISQLKDALAEAQPSNSDEKLPDVPKKLPYQKIVGHLRSQSSRDAPPEIGKRAYRILKSARSWKKRRRSPKACPPATKCSRTKSGLLRWSTNRPKKYSSRNRRTTISTSKR